MAVHVVHGNGNRTFAVRNSIPGGTWGSAELYVMHLIGEGVALVDVRAHGGRARFSKAQVLEIAANLTELAEGMPS